jgi:hypothetical protein
MTPMLFLTMLSKVKSSLPNLTNTPVLSANTTLEKSTIFIRDSETVVDPHSMSAVSLTITSNLATYVSPVVGKLPVPAVDTALVLKVLEPLWTRKPETASRVRGRMEAVLDWAKVRGYRTGENPARWRGHLDHLLPAKAKVRKVEHHAALPNFTSAGVCNGINVEMLVTDRCADEDAVHYNGFPALKLSLEPSGITQ